ncbi:MAG: hypothetical protein QMB65_04225, partial [Vicingaceae bacterium]
SQYFKICIEYPETLSESGRVVKNAIIKVITVRLTAIVKGAGRIYLKAFVYFAVKLTSLIQ